MPFPTERISLNNCETAFVLAGLNRIVNEFATVQLTCRRSPDTVNPWLKQKLQPRVLAPGSYEWILSLRNRLASVAGEKRAKFRFSVVDYAILAFGVRVARRHCQTAATAKLEGKLEIYRKRAKRKTIAALGQPAYKAAAKGWLCSSRWIRFNLLPLPSARPRSGKLRLRREQYDSLLRLAKEELMDRCTELPSEEMLCKFVELAAAEIRRGRHSEVKMRKFLADPVEGRKFLFDFIKSRAEKRNLDLHLKPENQPYCVTAALRESDSKPRWWLTPPLRRERWRHQEACPPRHRRPFSRRGAEYLSPLLRNLRLRFPLMTAPKSLTLRRPSQDSPPSPSATGC